MVWDVVVWMLLSAACVAPETAVKRCFLVRPVIAGMSWCTCSATPPRFVVKASLAAPALAAAPPALAAPATCCTAQDAAAALALDSRGTAVAALP